VVQITIQQIMRRGGGGWWRYRGSVRNQNVQNTEICLWLFWTGFLSHGKMQYFGYLGVISLKIWRRGGRKGNYIVTEMAGY
jgi:hypothetical protein